MTVRRVLIAICLLLGLAPWFGPGAGADPVVLRRDPLAFPVGAVDFPSSAVNFATSAVDFATAALSFPVGLEAMETQTTIEVTLAADVLFDFDKADIRVAAEPALRELAQMIRDKGHGATAIQGYTDGLGNDAYNQRLSERRAASVKAWLVVHERLEAARLTTAGFGPRNPVAANRHQDGSDNPEGRQRNRRVSIIIRK